MLIGKLAEDYLRIELHDTELLHAARHDLLSVSYNRFIIYTVLDYLHVYLNSSVPDAANWRILVFEKRLHETEVS